MYFGVIWANWGMKFLIDGRMKEKIFIFRVRLISGRKSFS
jgi:hypothetical protein